MKTLEKYMEAREEAKRKAEYIGVDIICPHHEDILTDMELANKLTIENIVNSTEFECLGCDACNIPDFI